MAQPMRVLQQQQPSPEAEQLAATYQLGTPQSEYKVGYAGRKKVGLIILFIVLIGLGGLFGAAAADPSGGQQLVFVILSLACVAFAIYIVLQPVIYRSWRAYVCSDGLLSVRGSKIEAFRWDQIEAMWQAVTRRYYNGIYTGTTHIYTVRSSDGRQVVFNDRFANVEQLGDTISREITNRLLPQVIRAYQAGNTITFGPLSISQQGVSNSKELLPWSQIKEVGVNRGVVTVKKEGKWLNWSSVMVAKVPNIFVFMALANYVLKSRQ